MNNRVRQKLRELIVQYGRVLCDEPRRCKGLLLDHCAGDGREAFVLISALEEQVAVDLLAGLGTQSWALVSGRLVRRLVEPRAMAEDAALWAVESWALALGEIDEAAIATRPESRPTHGVVGRPASPITNHAGTSGAGRTGPRRGPPPAQELITRVGQIRLKRIPAGEFRMGSSDGDDDAFDDEKPRHEMRIDESFYLGVTPVTQAQYQAVTGKSPGRFQGRPENPIESVSWYESVRFCIMLSQKEGLVPYYGIRGASRVRIVGGSGYRLPTEAEWEYACRAGTETRYCFGDDEPGLDESAWYSAGSGAQTRPVGQKRPNAWGLYDMHGNVWEWCGDAYEGDYEMDSPNLDPPGPENTACRVVRGGSWNDVPRDVRAASRLGYAPGVRFDYLGFRIAREDTRP
jgi:formylglycine-generating enzyme required for sulfatase activity